MEIANWYDYIPVVLNVTYGDPFIPEQIDDTVDKLKELMEHKVPIAIFTKAPYNTEVLAKLKTVANNRMVLPFYSLTGLNEGGYAPEERIRMIEALEDLFNRPVIIITRPIISGRNDSPEILQSLVDVAQTHSKLLVLGGVHDIHKNKKINHDVESLLIDMCDKAGVKCFHKSSCLVAYLQGKTTCSMHSFAGPKNLSVARALGYQFTMDGKTMVLEYASTGDLNFLRMLTHAEITAKEIKTNYNLLTISKSGQLLECTSSWYAWSRNIETCIGCNYCIILQLEYLEKKRVHIGVHPRHLLQCTGTQDLSLFSGFKRTKLKQYEEKPHKYDHVRVPKPCFLNRYLPDLKPLYPEITPTLVS